MLFSTVPFRVRPLRLSVCLLILSLLSTACGSAGISTAATLPTVAATALLAFDPSPTPVSPTPAPTLPSPTPAPAPPATATAEQPASVTAANATPTATPEPATPTPDAARQINGLPFETIAVLPDDVQANVRAIFARGQALGRNPNAFSKLGDSGVLVESNLTRFDNGPLDLGPYAFLQPTIDQYAGSWERYGVGARVALTTIGTFDPMFANPEWCAGGEHMLACEIRLHNPSVLLIRLGTNDGRAESYDRYMRDIVAYCMDNGVIPILGTKADRFEGDDSINAATRRIADELDVPLWEFDALAATLPNRGLTDDQAHLTVYGRNDYNDPETFTRGYPMSDLSALAVLDAVRRVIRE